MKNIIYDKLELRIKLKIQKGTRKKSIIKTMRTK
jgi:hypothetical protein